MRRLVPLILVVALVFLAGCGSSSGDSSSATDGAGSLTRAEFIARADALCEVARAKQEPLRRQLEEVTRRARDEEQGGGLTDSTRRELARTLGRIVAMAEASEAQLQALKFPKADAAQLEAIFQKTESAFGASLAYGAALEQREDAKAQAIAEKANAETGETAALAKRYGFKVCGARP
ncbi:MAG: hypothetical protein ACTHN7_03120 [Solirubrobacterales bacterium]